MFTKEAPQKTNNSKTQRQQFEKFDIRNFQDQLEATNVKGKYICPVCGGHNFSWSKAEPPVITCWNGCDRKEIKEAVNPMAQLLASRSDNYTPLPSWKPAKQKIIKPKPVPIPSDFTLVKLTEAATDIPQPQQLTSRPPKEVVGSATEIIYSYSPDQWVTRYQWSDASKEKGHGKTF
ncbi:MAG: heavy metal transporter, partial [Nostoc sp. NMS7]|nr:heavy metal transporter [Nostoc sp. NMS7]